MSNRVNYICDSTPVNEAHVGKLCNFEFFRTYAERSKFPKFDLWYMYIVLLIQSVKILKIVTVKCIFGYD